MTSVLLGQIALSLAFAACLAGAYKLGEFVAERRHAFREAEEAKQRKRILEANSRRQKPEWLRSSQAQPGTAGFTIAAALNGVGCLGRSQADEPVFVLCARDKAASMTVRDWASLAEKLGAKPEKTVEARAMADRMEEWRERHGGGKVPD